MTLHTLFIALPIPAIFLLILNVLYHIAPLLHYNPNRSTKPVSILQRLANIIPRPRSNLPREFFNLPPRPTSPFSTPYRSNSLGVRGKLILLLAGQAGLSLVCGWGYLLGRDRRGRAALLALSITPLPITILLLALFSLNAGPRRYGSTLKIQGIVFGEGGITESTIFPRILPLSLIPTFLLTIICAAVPKHAGVILIVSTSYFVTALFITSSIGGYRTYLSPKSGPIRLRETSPDEKGTGSDEVLVRAMMDSESWITSPCALFSI